MYDFIIVGGGLSGSLLGYLLKTHGYNVIIFEKQNIKTKYKLCGGIITPKTYSFLTSTFSKKEIDKLVKTKFTKCEVIANKKVTVDNLDIKIIDRQKLDNYLLNKYLENGGDIIDNSKITKIDFDNNTITNNNIEYKYNYLIGADGVLSYVRNKLTGRIQNKNFSLESFQKNNQQSDLIIEFIDKYKGYNWIIPTIKDICIGTGNINMETHIDHIFKELAKRYKLQDEKKGAFLPTGNDIFLNHKNVYFIGDAAGLISPITGEGIYYALTSAKLLFQSFEKKSSYLELMKPICQKISKELLLINLIYNDKIRHLIFNKMAKNNKTSRFIIEKVKKILLT